MNRPPAFQFYPKDWLDFKVQRMSFEAQGVYMKLLCFMWNDSRDQCSLPDDDEMIARALGATAEHWLKLRGEIQRENDPIFEQKKGRLVSKRLREEATKQRGYRQMQAAKGKLRQPRLNHGLATAGASSSRSLTRAHARSSSSSSYKERKIKERKHVSHTGKNGTTEESGKDAEALRMDASLQRYPEQESDTSPPSLPFKEDLDPPEQRAKNREMLSTLVSKLAQRRCA